MSNNKKKAIVHKFDVANKSVPRMIVSPDSFYKQSPVWSFKRCDFNHPKWGFRRDNNEILEFLQKLKDFEGQRWCDILTSTSGRKHNTRNHLISMSNLIKEAQDRASDCKLDEFDEICSLSLTGVHRVWGILLDGIYHIVWYDPDHEICPSQKS